MEATAVSDGFQGYEAEGMIYTVGYIKGLLDATGLEYE